MRTILRRWHWVAWGVLLFMLPITSFPSLARFARTNSVAAPSAVMLVVLILGWFFPYILKRGVFPKLTLPFLGFILVAIIASFLSVFLPLPPLKQANFINEMLGALLTLGIGSAFYIVASTWVKDQRRLQFIFRWITYGGLVLLGWSVVQSYFIIMQGGHYPPVIKSIQSLVSVRRLFFNRATGLAFEPSWLAHQLNMIYLPYWLAASILGYTAHRPLFRVLGFSITLERICLVVGGFVLFISFSRVGWLAFFCMLGLLALIGIFQVANRLQRWVLERLSRLKISRSPRWRIFLKWFIALLITLLIVAFFVIVALGLIKIGSQYDKRLDGIIDRIRDAQNFYDLANKLVFAERIIFWEVGWKVFNDYPVFGVGLGHAGLFLPEKMNWFGYGLVEIGNILFRQGFIPNTKSIWSRLLAETGIVGFSFFVVWLTMTWKTAWHVYRNKLNTASRLLQTAGLFGLFVVTGFLIEGFSVDTFALPYFWLSMGLVSAAVHIFVRKASV